MNCHSCLFHIFLTSAVTAFFFFSFIVGRTKKRSGNEDIRGDRVRGTINFLAVRSASFSDSAVFISPSPSRQSLFVPPPLLDQLSRLSRQCCWQPRRLVNSFHLIFLRLLSAVSTYCRKEKLLNLLSANLFREKTAVEMSFPAPRPNHFPTLIKKTFFSHFLFSPQTHWNWYPSAHLFSLDFLNFRRLCLFFYVIQLTLIILFCFSSASSQTYNL